MAISGNTATQGAPLIALQQLSMTFGGRRSVKTTKTVINGHAADRGIVTVYRFSPVCLRRTHIITACYSTLS